MTLYESVVPPLLKICVLHRWEDHVTKDLKEGINFAQTVKNHPSLPRNW